MTRSAPALAEQCQTTQGSQTRRRSHSLAGPSNHWRWEPVQSTGQAGQTADLLQQYCAGHPKPPSHSWSAAPAAAAAEVEHQNLSSRLVVAAVAAAAGQAAGICCCWTRER